jgi:hypothetical protein
MEAAWKCLRRGWYVGGEDFGLVLIARVQAALGSKRRGSNTGLPQTAHDQEQAERMLEAGMKLLGLETADLSNLPKGQTEKQVLAWWWLYGRTTVTRRWLAQHLRMGYETRVSQAVGWVASNQTREVVEMRNKLTENHK